MSEELKLTVSLYKGHSTASKAPIVHSVYLALGSSDTIRYVSQAMDAGVAFHLHDIAKKSKGRRMRAHLDVVGSRVDLVRWLERPSTELQSYD